RTATTWADEASDASKWRGLSVYGIDGTTLRIHDTLRDLLILPERRPDRGYKRHVKIKMSKFKRNPGKPVAKAAE
ncbi:MAG: hypothetical protein KAI47_04770, partial [Deltaproteobacteria bacterium]|nr:hypothetical protein [Deltaproteobacteria bacterium]